MAPQHCSEPIVVVGTGCRFPGDIRSPSQLWEAICSQKDLLTRIPPSRFNTKGFYHSNGERHGSMNVDHAYLLGSDISAFDANFFGINPREAEAIDPQQRILLETVYEAMEDAGLTISGMKGSDTAVYVGLMTGDYHEMQVRDPENMPMYMATGTARSIVSNRVSYFFDWKGPSMTIDTACSSSLVALHHAVQSLRTGECRIAVAAGANLILGPEMMIAESNLHMLSPTGRSRMWDTAADGYARGEGFAAVMLKTLSQALADGDTVEYIIRETGVNQDGRTQGITMPNAESQTALIRQVYHKAGLDCTRPEDRCQYFEAHGTGTPRGDPIEARAIRGAFFADSSATEEPMYVGSVKTVIGHLEGCAGLAGLLKAAEAVRRGEIPPNMHYTTMNPDIVPFARHLQVPTKTLPWPGQSSVRRASVNSFGFGGTNAHVIIESYDRSDANQSPSLPNILPIPFTFSAAKETSLVQLISQYISLIKSNNTHPLHEIAATLASRRSQHSFRATFSDTDKDKLLRALESALTAPSVGEHKQTASTSNRILAVFTGQGAQWACMGRQILLSSPMARETLKNLQASLEKLPDGPNWTLEQQLTQTEDPSLIQEAALSQPLCTAIQVMLVDLLRAAHVSFHTVVGHSSGEIAAAYAAGMISARDAIRIAYYRGLYARLARGREGGKGAMMAVGISFHDAQRFINDPRFQGRIAVAASNAPRSVTLSGDEDAIAEAKAIFEQQETFCRLLKVDTAYHSHHMLPCLEPYIASLHASGITPLKPTDGCIWVSSVHGRVMNTDKEAESLKANYWGDNMANTVLFSQAVQKATRLHGPFSVGLEVGPHPALKGPVTQTTKEESGQVLPYSGTLARFGHDVEALSDALGFLWKEIGAHAVDLPAYGAAAFDLSFQPHPQKQLPRYPWDHSQRFWKESRVSRRYRQRSSNRHDLLGARCSDDHDHEMRWRNTLRVSETPWLSGHKVQGQVIFPAAGYLVMAMQAAQELAADGCIYMLHLLDVNIDRAIALSEDKGVEVMFHLQPDTITSSTIEAKFSCYSATSDEEGARWQRNASGVVQVHLGPADHIQLPSPQEEPVSLVPVKMDTFYESLSEIGLEYTGLFQRLDQVKRRAGRATGHAQDIPSDKEMPVMIHPALLDAAFQTIFAAFCWPGDGTLHGPYVPTHLRSLRIVPIMHAEGQKMTIECTITESLSQTVTADVDIFTSNNSHVQLEGLTCTLLDPPTPEDDCELFAETVWKADAGAGLDPADLASDSTNDLELVDLCERLSYSYLRQLNAAIDRSEVDSMVWHHQRIFEFIDYLFPLIESRQHPTIRPEWKDDSHEWLLAQARQHPGMVDLQLISAVGEHLADVVRGKTTMLEHMIADNTLDRFYKYGLGFQRANSALSRVAGQIAHRYPRMRILEIGAGTGGATKGILEQLGDAFEQYVFTDISTGFFEKAQEQFAEWASRMTFKALNIEEDVAAQGFDDGAFDMIIASNVLHATRKLEYTMQNVRRLLKPGGYLLLLEVTSDILRVKLMMSGLSGWWLGADDGRRFAPTISAPQWHDLLIRTGFSGVDQRVPDFQDASKHMTSVMLSQVVDPDVALLRDPLAESHRPITVDRIVLVGGNTVTVRTLAEQVSCLIRSWSTESPVIVPCLEDMVRSDIGSAAAVVCLADLDQPVVWDMNDERLAGLKKLLNGCRQLLVITAGARDTNPYANMSIGLGRSLMYEYPYIRMQFLDLASDWQGQAAQIATAMARLILADKMELPSKRMLWSVEPEIVLQEGRWMIPRILPSDRMNRRLNASRRRITDTLSLPECSVEVVGDGEDVWCEKSDLAIQSDTLLVRTQYALLHGLSLPDSAPLYLSIGKVEHSDTSSHLSTGSTVLALNHRNLSLFRAPPSYAIPIESSRGTPEYLWLTALALVVNTVLDQIPPQGHILLVEPDPVLRRLVENRACNQSLSVTVVYFSPGHEDATYIPRLLPHRRIRTRLPVKVDCVLDCCFDKHPLEELPQRQHTVRLLDIFRIPSASQNSAALPSQKDLKGAMEAASECLKLQKAPVQLTPLPDVSQVRPSADYTSIIDYTASATVQTLVRPIDTHTLFRSDQSYLLVGCTGGLGQSLTRWMVQNGVRYLILTSRSVNKVNRVWLDELKRMGAQVHLFELDIADKSALLAMHNQVQRQLPPIAGVANAAMVLSDRLFSDMTVEDLQRVLNPKVAGTAHLDELFSSPTLDFFVLFSSLASIVGNRGQSNYGAANLFMTSLAARRKQRGLAGSVLDIGMVLGIGYVSQTGIYESTLRRFNYMPISEPKFHIMFTEAIIAGRPDQRDAPAEIITGLHRISESDASENQAFWAGNPRFSHYTVRDNVGPERTATAVVALRKQLAEVVDLAETTQVVSDGFLAKLGRILQVPRDQINPAQPLINLGVDSLMAVEVRSWFLKEMDVDVPVLRILGGSSPLELCQEAACRYMASRASTPPTMDSSGTSSLSTSQMLGSSQPISSATSHTGPLSSDGSKTPPETDQSVEASSVDDEEAEKDKDSEVVEVDRMSFAQERLWFLRTFLEDCSTYNVTMMYRVSGPTASALSDAFIAVVNRQDVLRSAYRESEEARLPYQSVLRQSPFRLSLRGLCAADGEIEQEFQRLCHHTYDLEHGESMAAVLFSHSPDSHTLLLGFHHIVFDGFSGKIFIKDLAAALSGHCLPALHHQYTDFARRQRARVQNEMGEDIAYWKRAFATLPAPMPLFHFCQVTARRTLTEYTTHGVQRAIPASTVHTFRDMVRRFRATPFHGHLAILQLLLARLLDLTEVCIGITDANRTDPDFLETIGFFVNLLPLRFVIRQHDSLKGLLQNTRDVTYQALQHSQVPFDVLLDTLAVPRSTTESPLFQILMNYKMGSAARVKTEGLEAELVRFQDARNPYDLVFDIEEQDDGTTLVGLQSQSYLYSQFDLGMLLDAYVCLLTSCAVNPSWSLDKHTLYPEEGVSAALELGMGPRMDFNDVETLCRRIDETVAHQPVEIAVKDYEGHSLTYGQMHSEIQFIAATLEASGVRPKDYVAVFCEPTIHSVCYLLAIWRLNAIYVPLDPQNPAARLQLILDDCQPKILIYHDATERTVREFRLSATKPITFCNFSTSALPPVPDRSEPSSPACALYTSGSTGVPKGIVLTHGSFVNQILGVRHQFSVGRETVLQQSSLGFDVSLDQMLQPLVGGGTLVVAPRHLRGDAVELARLMVREHVTYTYATPSEYAALLRYGRDVLRQSSSWRLAFVGGEALPPHLIRSFHALQRQGLRLINRYGPTEITVSSSCLSIDTCDPAVLELSRVSVGSSLPNYATYIMDANGRPLPVGYVGEIVIGGPGVAQGYLQKEELTRERFVLDPFSTSDKLQHSGRMYRTGDKGRLLPSGELMYLGRMNGDTQIKLRGFRVELEDIAQTILREAEGRLADAVVSVRGVHDEDGDRRFLVAFAVPAQQSNGAGGLQPFLDKLGHSLPLPQYMIPRLILAVDHLPRNPNGKLDRRSLDQLPLPSLPTDAPPQKLTAAQEAVICVWKRCLDPSSLPSSWSPSADFFQLGGNSLLMVRVQALLAEAFGHQVPLHELFRSSTVQGMAARFATEELTQSTSLIDWESETTPGELERQAAESVPPARLRPSDEEIEVCLTGSTGFLGSELLRHLVADPRVSRIHCVAVRSSDPTRPRALAVASDKIVVYAGDLTAPRLGLDADTWDALGERVNAIIHNGADVSFLKSYHSLRKANVQSTRELACLALRRRIPLHFVSTGGVAQLTEVETLAPESVRRFLPPVDGSMGYIASKWASEAYLESCAAQFQLPCIIHRPSNIVGEGVPSTDLIHSILEFSVRIQGVPALNNWSGAFDFVPVEDVALGLCGEVVRSVDALEEGLADPRFVHHCGAQKIPVGEIGTYLERKYGQALRTLDVDSWLEAARAVGLSAAMESLVTATLTEKKHHLLPSLSP